MSEAVVTLALGLYQWKDAYVAANQLEYMYDSIEWPLDYFLKCWPSSHNIYYAQVCILIMPFLHDVVLIFNINILILIKNGHTNLY